MALLYPKTLDVTPVYAWILGSSVVELRSSQVLGLLFRTYFDVFVSIPPLFKFLVGIALFNLAKIDIEICFCRLCVLITECFLSHCYLLGSLHALIILLQGGGFPPFKVYGGKTGYHAFAGSRFVTRSPPIRWWTLLCRYRGVTTTGEVTAHDYERGGFAFRGSCFCFQSLLIRFFVSFDWSFDNSL